MVFVQKVMVAERPLDRIVFRLLPGDMHHKNEPTLSETWFSTNITS
jgi:hypothetical protein